MIQTVFTAIAVSISTNIDELIVFSIILSQAKTKAMKGHVLAGLYLGSAILVTASLLAAFALHLIPQEWLTGFLGLIPLAIGIKVALSKEETEEGEADEIVEKLEARKSTQLFWTIALITIASGGDNLGIYIPYFATLTGAEIIVVLIAFFIFASVLFYLGNKIAGIPLISRTLEKYERVIVPIVFITLGIFIMLESGTIAKIIEWIAG